jgi:predicted adenylyl cyclase CyaB
MIEVEVRGSLDKQTYEHLHRFLAKRGKFVGHTDHEAFFLYGHPGYAHNPLERTVDIRLRNTNDTCEIMVKKKVSKNNEAREEISLALKDHNLETAKKVVKALGIDKALQIKRSSDVYTYQGVEWSLVRAPKNYFFYEAERPAKTKKDAQKVRDELLKEAFRLGLKVFDSEEDKKFIYLLFRKADKEVLF